MAQREHVQMTGGFSLAEIILVVAVVAILVSMSTPPIIEFMKRRDIQNEQNTMAEIVKAMKAYLEDRNTLPLDSSATWSTDLAAYTNLSSNQIANDTWGQPRRYIRYSLTDTFLGTSVEIFYVTLHSMGPDQRADGGAATAGDVAIANSGIAASSNVFEVSTAPSWWSNKADNATRISFFASAQPADDDIMTRFTDYPAKITKYKTSLERLTRIGEALETYARTKYNEMAAYCTTVVCSPTAEQVIYYPRSNDAGNPNTYYGSNVESDLTTYNSGAPIYNVDTDHSTRRTHMVNLMRILGLPDEYCCNALETFTPAGATKPSEMPFYYFSNPRPRNGAGGCSARPDPAASGSAGRTLPARMTIKSNNQDASVCG